MESIEINTFIEKPRIYAAWSKDESIRFNSTSGGLFTEFANSIISRGGYVAAAQYNDNCMVEHTLVSDYKDIEKLRQSKYVQSNLNSVYIKIKEKLDSHILVGFCGSPCQVSALYKYLGKEYSNLITMDFICRGMNSPKAYKAWLDEISAKEGSSPVRVWFKYKDGGWKTSPTRTRVDFADGHYRVYQAEENLYMYSYLHSNLFIMGRCGDCQFKGLPRKSDLTFADFWGIEEKYDDDKGTSLLMINTTKGEVEFNRVKNNIVYFSKDYADVIAGNPMLNASVDIPEDSRDFLKDLDSMSFSDALKKHNAYPRKQSKVKATISKIYHRVIRY